MTQHIEKQRVAERLNEAIGYPAGMEGLNTLLYGWTRKNESLRVIFATGHGCMTMR